MAFIQAVSGNSTNASTVITLTTSTAGDTLVIGCQNSGAVNTISGITDTQGNTWVQDGAEAMTLGGEVEGWTAHNIQGGANTITIAYTTGTLTAVAYCYEYSNVDYYMSDPVSGVVNQGASTTPTSGTFTPRWQQTVVVGIVGNAVAADTFTVGSGYGHFNTATNVGAVAMEDKTLSTATSTTVGFNISNSTNYAMVVVILKTYLPIQLVQTASGSGTSPLTVNFTKTPTGGNLLLADYANANTATVPTKVADATNTWTQLNNSTRGAVTLASALWGWIATSSPTQSGAITVTRATSAGCRMTVFELWSATGWPAIGSIVDNAQANATNGGAATTDGGGLQPSVTTVPTGDLIFFQIAWAAATSAQSWSEGILLTNSGNLFNDGFEIGAATTTYTPFSTWTTSRAWVAATTALVAASGTTTSTSSSTSTSQSSTSSSTSISSTSSSTSISSTSSSTSISTSSTSSSISTSTSQSSTSSSTSISTSSTSSSISTSSTSSSISTSSTSSSTSISTSSTSSSTSVSTSTSQSSTSSSTSISTSSTSSSISTSSTSSSTSVSTSSTSTSISTSTSQSSTSSSTSISTSSTSSSISTSSTSSSTSTSISSTSTSTTVSGTTTSTSTSASTSQSSTSASTSHSTSTSQSSTSSSTSQSTSTSQSSTSSSISTSTSQSSTSSSISTSTSLSTSSTSTSVSTSTSISTSSTSSSISTSTSISTSSTSTSFSTSSTSQSTSSTSISTTTLPPPVGVDIGFIPRITSYWRLRR